MQQHFIIYRAGDGYRWQLVTPDRRVVAISQEAYESEKLCREAVELVRESADACVTVVRSLATS